MMRAADWRDFPGADVAPLVADEALTWLRQLHWDVGEAWQVLEPARQAGQLPGYVVLDDAGRPVGWTAYLQHGQCLQVMAMVAPNGDGTRTLLDAILSSPEAAATDLAIVCVRDGSRGLVDALSDRGFEVEHYRYMGTALAAGPRPAPDLDLSAWPPDTDSRAARLCGRAYAEATGVRAFAPHGTAEEWSEYIGQLRKGPGCGWFAPSMSFVVPSERSDELDAMIMMTDLGPGTAHIAQLAVDPAVRHRGLGRRLVRAALDRAAAHGFDRTTLLVSETNAPALALYAGFGFENVARFVVASRRQPSVSTSFALATGGDSTRR